MIAPEQMRPGFQKWHLNPHGEQPWPFRPVLHHFTEPDVGDPHDHPWSFRTTILKGSYIAQVYHSLDESWYMSIKTYSEGQTYRLSAEHIHRIIELPDGECWTLVIAEPKTREPRFWRFGEVVESRRWDEAEFSREPAGFEASR